MAALELSLDRALIFRITHRLNIPWILANGIHCASSEMRDPAFVQIGNADLIDRRRYRRLPQPYGGTLADYVPFYFTPFTPMMLNIFTGWGGVNRQAKRDIVIMVSSLSRLQTQGVEFVFSDRHAYLAMAQFTHDLAHLDRLPWAQLQARDFKKNPNDPEKVERYQAEALVAAPVPVASLM